MKTDVQPKRNVIAELAFAPFVMAARLGGHVAGEIVTLAGQLLGVGEQWHGRRAAHGVGGVDALPVETDVPRPAAAGQSDTNNARAAERALRRVSYLPRAALAVRVDNARITLSGEVQWDYQRQNTVSAVRYLTGVTDVTDDTTLRVRTSLAGIEDDVGAATCMPSHPVRDDNSVAPRDPNSTATGIVRSWWARGAAHESVPSPRGARQAMDGPRSSPAPPVRAHFARTAGGPRRGSGEYVAAAVEL